VSILVTIDGPGGVGKSTAVQATAGYLRTLGVPVHPTSQPSPSALGAFIRSHADEFHGLALACLVAGDRHHQQVTEIEPALAAGKVVLCDRYLPSSLVLQVLDGVPTDVVWQLNPNIRVPDLALFLRSDPALIEARLIERGAHHRFERDPESSAREREMFEDVAEVLRARAWPVQVIDCTGLQPTETALVIANHVVPQLSNQLGTDVNDGSSE
jgi:dTMP kinase